MRRLSLLVAIACLASSSLTAPSAYGFHGHHGYGYGCGGYGGYGGYGGGYYGGYRGYYGGYGGYYGGPAFYGAGMGYYGATVYSQPYRYPAYYGQPYYSQPFVGQPYAATPVYGSSGPAQGTYGPVQGTYASAAGAAALAPPASPNGPVRAAGYEAPATATVTIQDDGFQPASLNLQPGTVVRWTNTGSQIHTVSSQDNRWSSRDIAPGETYSATVQYPGTYSYCCRHHTGMQGTIVVASAPAAAQPGGSDLEARSPAAAPARNY